MGSLKMAYYPVRVCPYDNPRKAPLNMQYAIFNDPMKNLYHIAQEASSFFFVCAVFRN